MGPFEQILIIFGAALILAALARRVGAPYPVFLAVGGAALAFVPGAPSVTVPPDLALALFVAPVLLDAAYDTSVRDLRDNWVPVTSLAVVAVLLTAAAVAVVVRALLPGIPWSAAITLGAIVAPPDAVAATAVLRQLRPPQRLLTILGGESLLNDATALLVYRVALGATLANSFSVGEIAPAFFGGVIGSILVGPALGWLMINTMTRITHAPTSIIVQFVTTFGVWIFAEHIGLSGVLTTVCYAITLARTLPARVPAALRIPAYAVWDTVVFAVNVFVFIFIGLQLRPILQSLQPGERTHYLLIAAAVLATVIAVRFAWHMPFNTVVRLHERRVGFHPPRPTLRPSLASGLVISWSGMRGIVTLAAALALPGDFPYRDIIVLVAFSVVLGTLVVQGLTLKALLRLLDLHDEDPVGHEVNAARERALEAALATLDDDHSPAAEAVRREFKTRLRIAETDSPPGGSAGSTYAEMHHRAVDAARQAVLAMRARDEIGDDAFHRMEEDLDWLEMAVPWLGDGS